MSQNLAKEVAVLHKLPLSELQARYAQAFGEPTHSHHKVWLRKRIAWRLQALAEGDLAERALQRARTRAAELANDADLRLSPPLAAAPEAAVPVTTSESANGQVPVPAATPLPAPPQRSALPGSGRLPPPGSKITRIYKGRPPRRQSSASWRSTPAKVPTTISYWRSL